MLTINRNSNQIDIQKRLNNNTNIDIAELWKAINSIVPSTDDFVIQCELRPELVNENDLIQCSILPS